MGLKPLEYLECYLDSPAFRENLLSYEKELENNSLLVKNLTKECRRLIQATEEFSKVQESFAHSLKSFKFEIIGETQTQEEIMIAESVKLFADVLLNIEEQRCIMLSTISARMLDTLERFRKEKMQQAKDEKKRFEKCSDKYYNSLEKHLGVNQKKKDVQAQREFDSALFKDQAAFQQASFQYVSQLQDVHAAKQYELVEPILGYIGDVTTFLHQAYDTALSTRPQLEKAQSRIQVLRETHKEEQEKAYELKAKVIEDGKQGLLHHPEFIKQGFLMVQGKRIAGLTHSWIRYFCQFSKSADVQFLRLTPLGQHNKPEFYQVKQCTRCKSEDIDRRFCIEVEMYIHRERGETKRYFMQAMSQADMKEWLEVMEGREPMYATMPPARVTEVRMLTQTGYDFICKCTQVLEKRGLEEEGIYRKPGVVSKASALMKDCIERGRLSKIPLDDEFEYDTKTVASAVKMYFSKQISEPLMTYSMYDALISAAKLPYNDRIVAITNLVNKLPSLNYKVLSDFITHLSVVACHSNYNLMQASNLGVVFGPTLIRPEVETVAKINNIKHHNIIVEMMIDEKDKIFNKTVPPETPQETPQDTYDRLEGASVVPPSPLLKSSSEDHILDSMPSKPPSQSSPSPSPKFKEDESPAQLDTFDNKPTYAIPRRRPPRPPPHIVKKPVSVSRSYTVDNLPTSDKDVPTAAASSPVVEKTSLSFQHSNSSSSTSSSNEERSPKLPHNNGAVSTTPSGSTEPMRSRSQTTAAPVLPKRSYNMMPPSPNPMLDKKRLMSDSAIQNEHLDKNDNRTAEGDIPPIPWRSGSLNSHGGGHTRARKTTLSSRRARTLYDCDSDDPNELSFKKGQVLMDVKPSEEPGWLEAKINDTIGLVPENYIELLS